MVSIEWLVGLALGAAGWSTRLETRINGLQITVAERKASDSERHEEVLRRLSRIEAKIDANGNGNNHAGR